MEIDNSEAIALKKPTHIKRIEVEGLFGYLNYVIPREDAHSVDFSRLIMLYGDNGCGKTTILRLLFSMLSPRRNRGDKSYLARTPFKRFAVYFDDGTSVSAEKEKPPISDFFISIRSPNQQEMKIELKVGPGMLILTQGQEEKIRLLLTQLGSLPIATYFLPDDRRVRSTFEEDTLEDDDGTSLRFHVPLRTSIDLLPSLRESPESHHLDLAPVIALINTWFQKHAFQGSNAGEENATSIYLQVIAQIASLAGASDLSAAKDGSTLSTRLGALENEVSAFSPFGLIQPFPADKFIATVEGANPEARGTIATVLKPYLDGLTARLKALTTVRDLLATYVETINSFLTDKSMEFTLQRGALIRGYGGSPLDPAVLSSGEKQLVLLLSNTILARDGTSIFIIDEPELSLNVKWQRRLVDALLKCARGSNIQYLLASHSLELITLHKGNAVRLVPPPAQ